MKNISARRILLRSAISMLLCLAMLVGTTYAWFTDSVSSKNNIIKTGTLQVDMEHKVDGSWISLIPLSMKKFMTSSETPRLIR